MATAPEPSLTLVSDRQRLAGGDLPALAAAAAAAGVDWIQIREKDLPDAALVRLARAVMEAVARTAGAARGAGARGLAAIRPFLGRDVAGAVRALRAAAAGEARRPSP